MSHAVLRRALRAPASFRAPLLLQRQSPSQGLLVLAGFRAVSSAPVPKVARPDFWKSIVPKFLRRARPEDDPFFTESRKPKKTKDWNPATFFIVIFLLIGSMSIQMIALKKEFATFIRRSDVRIGLLRDVVERLQRGETVDVEAALGTGVPEREAEWDDVLKEIEREEAIRKKKKNQQPQPQPEQSEPVPSLKPSAPADTQQAAEPVATKDAAFY